MNRFLILCLAIAVVATLSEAKGKKYKNHQELHSDHKFDVSAHNRIDKHKMKKSHDFASVVRTTDKEKYNAHMFKKHHKKAKSARKQHKKHLTWLNVQKDSDCGLKCEHGEVCISGPVDTKPLCVRKKDVKKSMKLFRRYQKQERKGWEKFQKENYYNDYLNKKLENKKHSKMASLKKAHLEKQGYGHGHKHGRKAHKPDAPSSVKNSDECTNGQFTQMRTRMMGWFHLLHGQDHLLKKEHNGNLKHFYKHESVKKELRENDGVKCECLKSAMWQFHKMDKNGDDHLTDVEISVMEENSLEPCMKPFLATCDRNMDQKLSSDEWCCCFSNIVAPCYQKLDEIRRSGEPVTYMPRCDKEGYFMREQCEGETDDTFRCWCVDFNGNEHKGTSVEGRAHCSKLALNAFQQTPMI